MTSRPTLAALRYFFSGTVGCVLGCTLILAGFAAPAAEPRAGAQETVLPLWPAGTPEPAPGAAPETDVTKPTDRFIDGRRTERLTNVSVPTLTVYPPKNDRNNGTAALVFPGGGYARLAWTGEGLDTCHWLNSIGVTCLLVKYRVPQPSGEAGHYPADPADLEDAQQAMRLARAHAREWHISRHRIGVVGFSAGANLAVLLSNHPDDRHVLSTPAASEVNTALGARPDFAIVVYPAYLGIAPDLTQLNPVYMPDQFTPPTFLIQAEDDVHYGKNAPLYFQALAAANVPAELHMYATGGHGFGVHPADAPEEHWTRLADNWLRSIHMIPPLAVDTGAPASLAPSPASGEPCPLGPPNAQSPHPNQPPNPDQPCDNPN